MSTKYKTIKKPRKTQEQITYEVIYKLLKLII